nr:protein POLAR LOCALIZATION DURING ASYMMETRIC DIVISION AND REDISTRIBUTION-like [Ipomoea batatas]
MRERTGDYSDDCSISVVAFTSCLSRRRRRRRNGGRRCPGAAAYLSPSWFFARWRKSRDEKKAPAKVLDGKSPLPLPLVDSGGQKEASFNLGIGLGLMYAIAGCRNELNKIVDLRLQFETLIQTYKAQNQQLSTPSDVSTLNNLSSFFNSDRHENFKDNGDCCGRHMKCNKKMSRRRNVGSSEMMDELEAELVAELGRLQLDLDSDVTSQHSTRYNEVIIVEESEGRQNGRFGGVEDVEIETTYEEYYEKAVSPYELEIRLHEVLEERQQERIEELESALESAMEKLELKDEELLWWKDTAKLISKHVPNVPGFLRRSSTTK